MKTNHTPSVGAAQPPDLSFLGFARSGEPQAAEEAVGEISAGGEGDADAREALAFDVVESAALAAELREERARTGLLGQVAVPASVELADGVTVRDLADRHPLAELQRMADALSAEIDALGVADLEAHRAQVDALLKRPEGDVRRPDMIECLRPTAAGPLGEEAVQAIAGACAVALMLAAEARREAASEALARSSSEAALAGFAELTPGNFDKTEDAFALSIERSYAPRLRYVHGVGKWRIWNGVRWVDDQSGAVRDLIRRSVRAGNTEGAAAQGRAAFVTGVENLMRCSRACATTAEEWDRDLMLLGTPSGTLDLTTGILHAAKPESLISKAAGVDPADPGAVPRRWLAFLHDCTGGDGELIDYLRRILGYALTGMTAEHKLVFIYGEGGNGKGVFLDTVRGIFGAYGQAADIKLFTAQKYEGHPTDRAALIGARLVTASETERGHAWAESRLKSLTGGDPIRARFMRQDEIQFDPQFQLLIVGNHKPSLSTIDDAIRRRLVLVEFNRKPAVVNPHLAAELRAEWPAILRWMIDGCLAWQRDGLGDAPAAVVAATEAYFDEQDTLGGWLAENCEIGDTFKESGSTLFRDWSEYCRAVGADAGSLTSFGTSLDRRGFGVKKSDGVKKRRGLRLRQFDAGQSLGSDSEGLL